MPDDAKERLRKSLQSCLRRTFLRLLNALDVSDGGTSKLLWVPQRHLNTFVPVSTVEGVACANEWTALLQPSGRQKRIARRRDHFESAILQYEPNLRVQALRTFEHRPSQSALLRCTSCDHPMRSNCYFVHPVSSKMQVLTPMIGHAPCHRLHNKICHYRTEDKGASIADNVTLLHFCEHALTVPLAHLHILVPGSSVEGFACREQWILLAETLGRRR